MRHSEFPVALRKLPPPRPRPVCETTRPVRVRSDDLDLGVPVPVLVLTHRDTWIAATATRYGMPNAPPTAGAALEAEADIEGGTSGGPVVDLSGRLIGVVSNAGGEPGVFRTGTMPSPHLALPRWVWQQIEAAQRRRRATR